MDPGPEGVVRVRIPPSVGNIQFRKLTPYRKKRILNPPRDLLAEVIGGQFCSREIVMNQNLYFSYILMVEAGGVEPPS